MWAKKTVRKMLWWMMMGERFKLYTRPGPGPKPGSKLRIAVCYLIPNLGDTVMVFPLIDAIRKENPEAEITCFSYGNGGGVLGLHPAVNHHYNLTLTKGWRQKFHPANVIYDIWSWRRRDFRDLQFDVCVMPRGGADPFYSAHLAWLIGGRERVGYSSIVEPERMEGDLHAAPLLTKRIERIDTVHEVSRGAEVLMLAGLIKEQVDLDQPVSSLLEIAHGSEGQNFVAGLPELRAPYAIVAPGASISRRQWPSDRFTELAEREILSRGWLPVFVGGPEMAATCTDICGKLSGPSLNLAGRTNFQQLAAVSAGAECFIGNDSGTAHVAGGCGVPTLIVTAFAKMGLNTHHSSPDRSRPVGPYFAVVQPLEQLPPCVEECLAEEPQCILQVKVEEMQAAFNELLERSSKRKDIEQHA
ncbi:MAG: glycosyltransferase family 9 protein [Edaphobacter sp.]